MIRQWRSRRIAWTLEVPAEGLRPERTLRRQLDGVADERLRARCLAALDELEAAREAVAAAAGRADRLHAAIETLEATFTRLTGLGPTRHEGLAYAGRTLVYEDCRRAMTKALEATTSSNSAVSQKAGEAALDGPQDCVEAMVQAYQRRRDLVVDLLRESGLLLTVPSGAFYILADVSRCGPHARGFAHRLLRERAVAVVPGTAFGDVARGAVRVSLASSDEALREGVGRLCDFVATST